ncbi:hypothetical protein CR513_27548, partial [Mucuna pruriens]
NLQDNLVRFPNTFKERKKQHKRGSGSFKRGGGIRNKPQCQVCEKFGYIQLSCYHNIKRIKDQAIKIPMKSFQELQ